MPTSTSSQTPTDPQTIAPERKPIGGTLGKKFTQRMAEFKPDEAFLLGIGRTLLQWVAVVLAASVVEATIRSRNLQVVAVLVLFLSVLFLGWVQRMREPKGTALIIQARPSNFDNRLFSEMKDFALKKRFRFAYPVEVAFNTDVSTWARPLDQLSAIVRALLDDRQAGAVDKSRIALFLNGPVIVCWWLGLNLGFRNVTQFWGQTFDKLSFCEKVTGQRVGPSNLLTVHRRFFPGNDSRCVLFLAMGRHNQLSAPDLPSGVGEALILERPNLIADADFSPVAQEAWDHIQKFVREHPSMVFIALDGPTEIACRLGQLCSGEPSRFTPMDFDSSSKKYLPIATPS